ncbi:transcriptional regulators [Zymobacter palmae]|uniref:Transcriptional regulators n=1 Tax=Zymobacter palmae TaxID=33074 RepID=A0A348HBT1_9GAMM|nr:transcriptional regulators [Zymobacter palmae]
MAILCDLLTIHDIENTVAQKRIDEPEEQPNDEYSCYDDYGSLSRFLTRWPHDTLNFFLGITSKLNQSVTFRRGKSRSKTKPSYDDDAKNTIREGLGIEQRVADHSQCYQKNSDKPFYGIEARRRLHPGILFHGINSWRGDNLKNEKAD